MSVRIRVEIVRIRLSEDARKAGGASCGRTVAARAEDADATVAPLPCQDRRRTEKPRTETLASVAPGHCYHHH